MKWFALQSVFRHSDKGKSAIYEERIVLYRARTSLQAAKRATKDIEAYLAANPQFSAVSMPSIFALSHESEDLDGAEIWSCLHKGPANSKAFWSDRYEKFSLDRSQSRRT